MSNSGKRKSGTHDAYSCSKKKNTNHLEESNRIYFTIDSQALECTVCFGPLSPPLFQCMNGHTACSGCCSKLKNKCHICFQGLGHSRCLALEKVMDSIRIPCANAAFGCYETIKYTKHAAHKDTCAYTPCACPFPGCYVESNEELLDTHITFEHHLTPTKFYYNRNFVVTLKRNQKVFALRGGDGTLFMLLNNSETGASMELFMTCVVGNSKRRVFNYELVTRNNGCVLRMEDSVAHLQQRSATKVFLIVPLEFRDASGEVSLEVKIRKI